MALGPSSPSCTPATPSSSPSAASPSEADLAPSSPPGLPEGERDRDDLLLVAAVQPLPPPASFCLRLMLSMKQKAAKLEFPAPLP